MSGGDTVSADDPIDPLLSALLAAGIGAEWLARKLTKAERNLDQLDRMTLALYNLAEELNERGGKVNGPELAAKIHAIRDGAA